MDMQPAGSSGRAAISRGASCPREGEAPRRRGPCPDPAERSGGLQIPRASRLSGGHGRVPCWEPLGWCSGAGHAAGLSTPGKL